MNTDTVMCECTLQEFTAGCNKIYVRALFLLKSFTASYSLGLDQTRQDRKVGWHLGICELGAVKVYVSGDEKGMGDCIYISDPPLAPGEQAGLLLRQSGAQVLSTGINLSCLSTP